MDDNKNPPVSVTVAAPVGFEAHVRHIDREGALTREPDVIAPGKSLDVTVGEHETAYVTCHPEGTAARSAAPPPEGDGSPRVESGTANADGVAHV